VNRGEGAEVLSRTRCEYVCRCSREALLATLNGFGAERVEELFQAGSPMEVRCDYCGKVYSVAREDLKAAGGEA
jgi:molecular chaperone Hsp33